MIENENNELEKVSYELRQSQSKKIELENMLNKTLDVIYKYRKESAKY